MSTFTAAPQKINHIIRMFNTNISGQKPAITALTAIKGIGRRFADCVLKRANIDPVLRAGELTDEQLDSITKVIMNPGDYNIPDWFMNRQRDFTDGSTTQLVANALDSAHRFFMETGKKMRHVRVHRLTVGLKVRGQRTKRNGRHGGVMGVSRKK